MAQTRTHGYARVSAKEQNEARQIQALREFGIQERDIYLDKSTGADFDRAEYNRMLNSTREGDLIVVCSIDRLGRGYGQIQQQWRHITGTLGADIKVLDMPLLDTRSQPGGIEGRFVSDLVLQILSYAAQKERDNIKTRQAQGIAAARARGAALGRPRMTRPEGWDEVYSLWHDKKEITAKEAMARLGLKKSTFYRLAGEGDAPAPPT